LVKLFHINLHATHCFDVLSKPHFIKPFNLQYRKDRKMYQGRSCLVLLIQRKIIEKNQETLPFSILVGNQYCQHDLSILSEGQHCGSKLQCLAILIKEHINWDCSPQSSDAEKYQFTLLLVGAQATTHFFNVKRTVLRFSIESNKIYIYIRNMHR